MFHDSLKRPYDLNEQKSSPQAAFFVVLISSRLGSSTQRLSDCTFRNLQSLLFMA